MLRIFNKKGRENERKSKSFEMLKMHGIECNSDLPLINFDNLFALRSVVEIFDRIIILFILNKVATNELSLFDAKGFLERYPIYFHLTKEEVAFLQGPTTSQKIQETWKMERIWVLLWSVGLVDTIDFPTSLCMSEKVDLILFPNQTIINCNTFYTKCKQKSESDILDMTDLYLRINWFCIENKLEHKNLNKINSKVVFERLYALKWLNKSESFEWDAMPCDRLNELSIT